MSENSQNLLQSADNEKQLIGALGLITLKTGTGKDIKDLKKAVSGDTVKKAVDELAKNINEQLITIVFSKMNDKIPLWYYQPKVVSLYIYTLEV